MKYEVVKGDSLWSISEKHLGSGLKWKIIYELNKKTIKNPELIYPGQLLKIPNQIDMFVMKLLKRID